MIKIIQVRRTYPKVLEIFTNLEYVLRLLLFVSSTRYCGYPVLDESCGISYLSTKIRGSKNL
jgi:hypothetical protein